MRISRAIIATLVVAGLIACSYFTYRLGKRDGWRAEQAVVAQEIEQTRIAAERKIADADKAVADAVKAKVAAEEAAKHLEVDPSISTPQETADAVATLSIAGGLVLPKQFFVVAGSDVGIYLRSIVPVRDPEVFRYAIAGDCTFAQLERRRIALHPTSSEAGSCNLSLEVLTLDEKSIEKSTLEVIVVPQDAPLSQSSFQILMVGDSLGHQSRFPNELADILKSPGNPKVEFVGTFKPEGAKVLHEQYGGWTFSSFLTNIDKDPEIYHASHSPFVFKGPDDAPQFDVTRYLNESLDGARPRNVHIQLGINDAFGFDPLDPELRKRLIEIMAQADALIAGIRKALPDAVITVGSVIQANASDRAFVESYRPYEQFHSEWRWRRVEMALAKTMVEHFDGRNRERIFLVPTHMTVDPLDGYTAHEWVPDGMSIKLSNAVHPSAVGARQLATTIHAVVRAELASLLAAN